MAIKALLLDLGNVLTKFGLRTLVFERIVLRFGGNPALVATLFGNEPGEARYWQLDTGKMSHEELYRRIVVGTGIRAGALPYERFCALYVTHLQLIESMLPIVRKLQDRFKLVVVSNGDFGSRYVVDRLETDHGIEFAESFVSSEIGVKKPGMLAVVKGVMWQSHQIAPHECLFIDDIPEYAKAAEDLGMKAFVHNATIETTPGIFEAKLHDHDIFLT